MIAITHSTAADWLRRHYPDPGFWETHDFDTAADRLEDWALNDGDAVEYCHNRPAVWKCHPGAPTPYCDVCGRDCSTALHWDASENGYDAIPQDVLDNIMEEAGYE